MVQRYGRNSVTSSRKTLRAQYLMCLHSPGSPFTSHSPKDSSVCQTFLLIYLLHTQKTLLAWKNECWAVLFLLPYTSSNRRFSCGRCVTSRCSFSRCNYTGSTIRYYYQTYCYCVCAFETCNQAPPHLDLFSLALCATLTGSRSQKTCTLAKV